MKKIAATLAFLVSFGLVPVPVSAQYPAKPIKLIVPFPPGGPTDIVGRFMAQKFTEALGQPVIVENRPGAAGTIGAEAAAKSPGDGYTLLLGTTGTLAVAPGFYPNLGYDPGKSFAPVSLVTKAPFLVVVHTSVPADSLRALIDLAKSKPGQLNFGSGGNGHPLHIAGEMFKIAASVDLVHVPYKGTAPALADLLAGRIQVMFEQIAAFRPHLQSGKLKALAVAAPRRLAQLPLVPTTAEAGLPGYEVSTWFGLVAPKGTPNDVVARLSAEVQKFLTTTEVRDALSNQGFEPTGSSPEEFATLIGADGAKWSRAVKASGAKLD